MANALYDKAREGFLKGEINWLADTIKAMLVIVGEEVDQYTVQLATHQYLSDVPSDARVATATLGGKTATGGIADAGDVTFTSVTDDPCAALILYKDTGNESTSPLLAYIDEGLSLPITPNGGDIVLEWSDTHSKIFKL